MTERGCAGRPGSEQGHGPGGAAHPRRADFTVRYRIFATWPNFARIVVVDHDCVQVVERERLGEAGVAGHRGEALPREVAGDADDGDARGGRVGTQAAGDLRAIHAGHVEVKQDERRSPRLPDRVQDAIPR